MYRIADIVAQNIRNEIFAACDDIDQANETPGTQAQERLKRRGYANLHSARALACRIADDIEAQEPRFDRRRFMHQCGIGA